MLENDRELRVTFHDNVVHFFVCERRRCFARFLHTRADGDETVKQTVECSMQVVMDGITYCCFLAVESSEFCELEICAEPGMLSGAAVRSKYCKQHSNRHG